MKPRLPVPWAGLVSCLFSAMLLSACGGGGSSGDSSRTDDGSTERALAVDAAVPLFQLQLSSAVGGSLLPFTVGQPLRQGDVPAGLTLTAEGVPELQAVITNRWPDGSAKFAIVSGRADLQPGSWRSIGLSVAAPSQAAAPLTTENLRATGITARVDFGAFGTVGWSAGDWDTPARTVVSGPQMSAWTFRKPIGSDAHLVAWLEVRAYKGGQVEVLPWIENGYLNVPGATEKSASATFTLGNQMRFSQPLTLLNHQRAVLASGTTLTHWLGADPVVTPRHDTTYFMDSRLVPRYSGQTVASSPLLAQLVGEYTPLMQGGFPDGMGHVGYDGSIGLLPMWDVAYLTSQGDPRAWRSTIINGYAAGRYGLHYRDETTQRPLAFSKYPHLVMSYGSGVSGIGTSSKNQYTPSVSGATPPSFTTSHHPSMGYLAYLISGWHYFREETQFVATLNYLKQSDTVRQGSGGVLESSSGALTPRGAAWALRSLSQAAIATPDDDPLSGEFKASINANIDYYHGRYVAKPNNPLGLVQPYGNGYTNTDPLIGANWMDDFFTGSFAFMKGLKLHDETLQPKLDSFLAWKFRAIVGRLGGSGPDQFAYPYAGQYTVPFAPSLKSDWVNGTGPWYANWGEVARAMNLPTNGEPGHILDSGYRADPTGYWGNLMPALAYAVDEGAEGAEAAWERVQSSPDYKVTFTKFNDTPVWSVYPRSKSLTLPPSRTLPPTALFDLKPGHWLELPETKIASVLPVPAPRGWPAAVVWGTNGATADTLRSRLLVWGGGNGNYWGNEMYALELDSLSIRRIVEPSPFTVAGQDTNCATALPDGTPRSRATGGSLTYIPSLDSFFAIAGNVSYCLDGTRPSGGVWLRDFNDGQWLMKRETAPVQYGYGVMAVYDELTRKVFIKDMAKFQAYSPETDTFTVLNANMPVDYHLSAALDTKRRKLVMLGNGVQIIDLATNTMSTVSTINPPGLVTGKQSPGVAYDPVADRIVAWHGGSEVWALDMDTLEWTQVAANDGPTAAAPAQGTHGRWAYIPKHNVFALINDINQNAWVFKLGTEAGQPMP
ncbi:hypothetical protein [uncultured Azohydromonas sp.]|jgi:hypothetical protein|uniref:hypothetical protein n=1 Tax=uncultured Azohydromonas sp. TaxID=487342 RepID=UPI00260773A5|nr:hypothetical protein [uncultured Azohydromonas sp.]